MSVSPRAFVSGCFDIFHAGHVAFLEAAAHYGALTVCVGSDATIVALKGRPPFYSQAERVKLLSALKMVQRVLVGSGSGYLDFAAELRSEWPDVFIVNADGDRPEKRQLCHELGIEYLVLRRTPPPECAARSSSSVRPALGLPYRIDLAGGWLDQPFVSQLAAGSVVVVSLEPGDFPLNSGSGLATSTRMAAAELWGDRLPDAAPEALARVLFAYENPPGKLPIAGSQDAIGLMLPGLSRLDYAGDYWPRTIESLHDEEVLAWLEAHLRLMPIGSRPIDFDVLADAKLTAAGARALADAATACWQAIVDRDLARFAESMTDSFHRQVELFPRMITREVTERIEQLPTTALGYKVSGAGGGGYLIYLAPPDDSSGIRISIRRANAFAGEVLPRPFG
jgi:cytidyltransferase-like protein